MTLNPWPEKPVTLENFHNPPREYGILPFWFLNGELDPDEMLFQLKEYRAKGMPGIILHGRYGLEMPYLGPKYLERIRFAVEQAEKLDLKTWIYDEMNWPSGTADKRVLQARPDLAQRYIECVNFTVRGPWFTYLTGADSRYLDFEKSTPVAAFAVPLEGTGPETRVVDLTPYLSFRDVIPWEAPAGTWRLMYIVEKRADYYIDALDPESTREFLRLGYAPYAEVVKDKLGSQMPGFYTDEPAMHYYLTGEDNPVLPWTRNMFRRFQERNGYDLRPRLPDLFFDILPDGARIRYDFFNTLTDFYSQAYYKQIQDWCRGHGVLFTGHLLYEEWLRKLVRVEGNLFKHYAHMDVIGVDHLYPIIGNRDRPDEHVAIKVASSAAHQFGSPRLLCESFGGIFMDATMQRMKWIADWEYVLGVNLLNPHGFHYTLEGARKRDWPPSQFYQYPWWRYYGEFSKYISRLSHMLSGGRHAARAAVLWPLNAIFATDIPQKPTPLGARMEADFAVLTDTLLRLHYDFDYLDEDGLAKAELTGSSLKVNDEAYELIILPPLTHIELRTLETLEKFVAAGGRLLGMIFLPDQAFDADGMVDISRRMKDLFGVDPSETKHGYTACRGIEVSGQDHPGGGKARFWKSYALARRLPRRLQEQIGRPGLPEHPDIQIAAENESTRYFLKPADEESQEITDEVNAERAEVDKSLFATIQDLLEADILIDNPDLFSLQRVKDGRDIFFIINPTFIPHTAQVTLPGEIQPVLWDPGQGTERPVTPVRHETGRTHFNLSLGPVESVFLLPRPCRDACIIDTNITVESIEPNKIRGYGRTTEGYVSVEKAGAVVHKALQAAEPLPELALEGEWEMQAENDNTLVLHEWLSNLEKPGEEEQAYLNPETGSDCWLQMGPGAWSYQLPAEPEEPYPLPVWYRLEFQANYLPPRLDLIVDGFACTEWKAYVNGQPVTTPPTRSFLDSQMKALNIAPALQKGRNVITLRLTLAGPTDGLTDLVKLCGEFSLEAMPEGGYALTEPRQTLSPANWSGQGYPFYSGVMTYRKKVQMPQGFVSKDERVFLDVPAGDDALEVLVNDQPAGVRLWAPYLVEVTDLLKPGENWIELRIANTLINELEGVPRESGLRAAPKLMAYHRFEFDI